MPPPARVAIAAVGILSPSSILPKWNLDKTFFSGLVSNSNEKNSPVGYLKK